VDIVGAGVAKYVGAWYLREVTTMSTLAGRSAFSFSAMARRFFSPPREYVEFSGGIGREVVVLGPGPSVDVRETRFLQGRIQKFLSRRWGLSAAVMYNRFEGAPERKGLSLGLITRF
jgi:YaiO family outer membrane protein